jgi:hydrogenase expression/formation protein HypC
MCVGITSKIIKIEDSSAIVDVLGAQREISLLLLNEDVSIGDYVIVHAGFAIQKIQEDIALNNIEFRKKMLGMGDDVSPSVSQKKRSRKKTPSHKKVVQG